MKLIKILPKINGGCKTLIMIRNIVIIAILIMTQKACAQKNNEDYLLGKWVVYKTTDQNNDSLTFSGTLRENRPDTIEFLPEGKLNVYWCPLPGEPPDQSEYSLSNDSILKMGNRMYAVRIIDENRMILDDYEPSMSQMKSLLNREYWRRID